MVAQKAIRKAIQLNEMSTGRVQETCRVVRMLQQIPAQGTIHLL